MRFECKVRVVNRNPGGKSCSSYIKSTIALGKETFTDNDYFLLHFSNIVRGSLKGSRYTKYRLKQNPTKVFTKCINEGKMTISFEDPAHDLFIQGEASQLIRFVELFNLCLAGEVDVLPTTITVEAKERYNKHLNEEKLGKEEIKKKKKSAHQQNNSNFNSEGNHEPGEFGNGNTADDKIIDKNDSTCCKDEEKLVFKKDNGIPDDKIVEQTFLAIENDICSIDETTTVEKAKDITMTKNEGKQDLTEEKNEEDNEPVTNCRKKKKRIKYRRLEVWFSDSLRFSS